MVSVYDSVNLWNGFIDPNSPLFAVYSTDLPTFFGNGVDALTGSPADAGPPVITNGIVSSLSMTSDTSIQAGTFISAVSSINAGTALTAGTTLTAGTSITAGTTVTANKFFTSPVGSGLGSSGSPLTASAGQASFTAGYAKIWTTKCTGASIALVTVNFGAVGGQFASAVPGNGFLEVFANNNSVSSSFYWLVIN